MLLAVCCCFVSVVCCLWIAAVVVCRVLSAGWFCLFCGDVCCLCGRHAYCMLGVGCCCLWFGVVGVALLLFVVCC